MKQEKTGTNWQSKDLRANSWWEGKVQRL